MLDTIGLSTLEELYAHLPEDVRFHGALNIPSGKSEYEAGWSSDRARTSQTK